MISNHEEVAGFLEDASARKAAKNICAARAGLLSAFRFRLATLLIIVSAISGLLAAGTQMPWLVLASAPFVLGLLVTSIAAFAARSRFLFLAGLTGCFLGFVYNPWQALVSWKPEATWWDKYSFYATTDMRGVVCGAIVFLVIAGIIHAAWIHVVVDYYTIPKGGSHSRRRT